jgi:hypothetical protein
MENPLKFEELYKGMEVEDPWGYTGKIYDCSDNRNVVVHFDSGLINVYYMSNDCSHCENRDTTPIYRKKSFTHYVVNEEEKNNE